MLSNTVAGDRVIICRLTNYGTLKSLKKVDRVTRTQVIIGNNKYHRNGVLVGTPSYAGSKAYPATRNDVQKLRDMWHRREWIEQFRAIVDDQKYMKEIDIRIVIQILELLGITELLDPDPQFVELEDVLKNWGPE